MSQNLKVYCLLFVISYSLFVAPPAQAQTMSNDDYIIKMQGFNTASGVTAGEGYNLRSTVGDLSPAVSEGVNYKVRAGFENFVSALPFSILLSSDIVDFGILSPTNPIIRTVDLTVNSLITYGYSVVVSENEPLTTIPPTDSGSTQIQTNKVFIPDTTCDNGQCGTRTAAEWINIFTYGFGYRCDSLTGTDCSSSFANPNFYKHFPNITNNDSPQSIIAGIGSNNIISRISYKVNISGTQIQDIYGNIITYIAIPNF